eukprot:TRINITY_DN3504_c0_g2_i1.p1 TRINITY_DN3504_c0_g2~~TRINITY_DN3504_c0_g2_i1.p1  ORF type:complete len:1316 (+),score=284.18 TRINITY_DN3504_c0_g2_i1:786-4733(+)
MSSLDNTTSVDEVFTRLVVQYKDKPINQDTIKACALINQALDLRKKWLFKKCTEDWEEKKPLPEIENLSEVEFVSNNGVIYPATRSKGSIFQPIQTINEFIHDLLCIQCCISTGPVKTYTYYRLKLLDVKFRLHTLLNRDAEKRANQLDSKDWDKIMKVDTHVHLASAMTRKHLIDFMMKKFETSKDEVVFSQNGNTETLSQVFERLTLNGEHLSIDALDVFAGAATFQRFDQFNSKYNPFGNTDLRSIFLKTENYTDGKYFAEITKELFEKMETDTRLQATEYRVSIYGAKRTEWDSLAKWITKHKVKSAHNRFLVQIPRIYNIYKASGHVSNFQQVLDNIFLPLFEATKDPTSHPELALFLEDVSGFDTVDDESRLEEKLSESSPPPALWQNAESPCYAYYCYYLWANLTYLNRFRELRRLNVFEFRPHCGESGEVDNLCVGFLLAKGINHGINLQKSIPLEYLYYVAQIGLAVSPLSNNRLFLDYKRNPFPIFFERGLNVSLSTDDPLQFHYTQNPLVEEYVIAAKRWGFTETDLNEIARNSVLQSGFSHAEKVKWLGPDYYKEGTKGNKMNFSNLPNMRIAFRYENWIDEINFLETLKKECKNQESPMILIPHVRPTNKLTSSYNPVQHNFTRILIVPPKTTVLQDPEYSEAKKLILKGLNLRTKYQLLMNNADPYQDENITRFLCDINFHKYIADYLQQFQVSSNSFALFANSHEFRFVNGVINIFRGKEVFCSYCEDHLGCIQCDECKDCKDDVKNGVNGESTNERPSGIFCAECDRVLHRKPSLRTHMRNHFVVDQPLFKIPDIDEFLNDLVDLRKAVHYGPVSTFCHQRLEILETKYDCYMLMNDDHERHETKTVIAKDPIIRVDTHVHISSGMVASHLLNFMKNKLKHNSNDVVLKDGAQEITLGRLFEKVGLNENQISIDSLAVQADFSTFQRFDKFKAHYAPFGNSEIQQIFLRRTNDQNGKYLAELTKEVFKKNEKLGQYTEFRISIYGRTSSDWQYCAWWITHYGIFSPFNRWVVQIPRLYHVYKEAGEVNNFQQFLDNLFLPLFEASKHPEKYVEINVFLSCCSSFDIADDEGQVERFLVTGNVTTPDKWNTAENPPYVYYSYYIYMNLIQLNRYRKLKGLNTFDFRPHSGASGDVDHLNASFLFAENISHGLNLIKSPSLQYLYYLTQIGITVSPASEDSLYVPYNQNPLRTYFKRGLQISLSSDNPLQIHRTSEPLSEEYAVASQMWKLSENEICELCRNSVLISGFSPEQKQKWIGKNYKKLGPEGNDILKTKISDTRMCFRQETLENELLFLDDLVQ